jgi:hypothetical protein
MSWSLLVFALVLHLTDAVGPYRETFEQAIAGR